MKYKIENNVVKVHLNAGEKVMAEAGALAWMTSNIAVEAKLRGGLSKSISRALTNESLFLTEFLAERKGGFVTFAGHPHGEILSLKLRRNEELICQKDAFMLSDESISFIYNDYTV